jgi:hypothetical protein
VTNLLQSFRQPKFGSVSVIFAINVEGNAALIADSSVTRMPIRGHQYLAKNNKDSLEYFINQQQKSQPSRIK